MSDNPYAPTPGTPGGYVQGPMFDISDAEAIRKQHLNHEASIQGMGSLYLLGGFFGSLLGLAYGAMGIAAISGLQGAIPNNGPVPAPAIAGGFFVGCRNGPVLCRLDHEKTRSQGEDPRDHRHGDRTPGLSMRNTSFRIHPVPVAVRQRAVYLLPSVQRDPRCDTAHQVPIDCRMGAFGGYPAYRCLAIRCCIFRVEQIAIDHLEGKP